MSKVLAVGIEDPRLTPYRKFTIEVFCRADAVDDAVLESVFAASDVPGCIGARCVAEPGPIGRADLTDIRELLPYVKQRD